MTDISPERRQEIAARCKAATGGEWTWEDGPATVYAGRGVNMHGMNLFGRLDPDWNGPANLDFVCHARADVPDLLAALEAAEDRTTRALADWLELRNGICEALDFTVDEDGPYEPLQIIAAALQQRARADAAEARVKALEAAYVGEDQYGFYCNLCPGSGLELDAVDHDDTCPMSPFRDAQPAPGGGEGA